MTTDHRHPVDAERVRAASDVAVSSEEADEMTALLDVVSDPTRARIIMTLGHVGEMCVGDLALALETSEGGVSYALRVLRASRLVRPRREGRFMFYGFVDNGKGQELAALLHRVNALADVG
jgi:DNA-binding transcriptional ArsR family regulator